MKIKEMYTPPQVEEMEVMVEAGFTYSAGINDTEEGDPWSPSNQ